MPPRFATRLRVSVILFAVCFCLVRTDAPLFASPSSAATTPDEIPPGELSSGHFDYAWLKGHARYLASRPYKAHNTPLPVPLRNLSWDQYQRITFDKSRALWTDTSSPLRVEFFHRGLYFQEPVSIFTLDNGTAHRMDFSPSLFDYGNLPHPADKLPPDMGFAGFRLLHENDWTRDIVSFLGASYFRAVSDTMQYGLSARGLAVDTALPHPEEFPRFVAFWLQPPAEGSDTMTVYALLDSPSVSGAYRFDIIPGPTLRMKVDAAIYPREPIERLGIAPLTSMYMVGENNRRTNYDWRPEIHDSDGLAMHTGHGQWIWRPLENPETLRFNAYQDENPKGFGLLQRDLKFDHYLDDGVFYDKRPSLWVEPKGDWGKGSVQLVEIPTLDETFDNIVAFWHPERPIKGGEELLYSYTLHWGTRPPLPGGSEKLAHVAATYSGLGGEVGQKRTHYSKRFVVDFKGGRLSMLDKATTIKASIRTSAGHIELASVRRLQTEGGYRAMFDVVPPDAGRQPINLRLRLEVNGMPLTETWMYQWTPPAKDQRRLHNPGHLN